MTAAYIARSFRDAAGCSQLVLDAYDLAGRRRDTCDLDAGIGGCRSLVLGPLLRAPLAVTDVSAQVTCTSSCTLRGASRRAT